MTATDTGASQSVQAERLRAAEGGAVNRPLENRGLGPLLGVVLVTGLVLLFALGVAFVMYHLPAMTR